MRGESEVYVAFPRKGTYLNLGASRGILERFGPADGPAGGTRRRARRPEGPPHRSARPLVLAVPRPPGRGGRGRAAAGARRGARSRSPRPTSRSTHASSAVRSGSRARRPSRRSSSSRCAGRAARRRSGSTWRRTSQYRRRRRPSRAPTSSASGALDGGSQRAGCAIQVTDLALATVEEPHGRPLRRHLARDRRAGRRGSRPRRGRRDVEGHVTWESCSTASRTLRDATWQAPGYDLHETVEVRRIVVQKGPDVLVLDPRARRRGTPTAVGADAQSWLQWTLQPLAGRQPRRRRCATSSRSGPSTGRRRTSTSRGTSASASGAPSHATGDERHASWSRAPETWSGASRSRSRRWGASTRPSPPRSCRPAFTAPDFEDDEAAPDARPGLVPDGGVPHPRVRGPAARARTRPRSTASSRSA